MPSLAGTLTKSRGVLGATLALASGHLPVRGRGAAVLCYHDIGTDPTNATDYYLPPDLLRDHVRWLRRWGYTIVPLAEIVDRVEQDRELDGLAALTFDDALAGVGERAAAILEDLRAPATVFVVAGVLGREPDFWAGADRTLTASELRDLTRSGLVTLGSHTCTHASLPGLGSDERRRELTESRARLEEIAGQPVDLFAFPSGRHDAASEEAVRDAGYRAACTFSFGRVTPGADRYAIPRFCIGPDHDRFRLARQLARPAPVWESNALNPNIAPRPRR
jgi:peptidoglycan/xylan/chitin deacetylase (PgdA/CDA1 family)